MRLFETSLLEILLWPVFLFPWMKGQTPRGMSHYEHTYTGVLLSFVASVLPLSYVFLFCFASMHIIMKEVIFDWGKNNGFSNQMAVDLTTRTYGFVLGFLMFF